MRNSQHPFPASKFMNEKDLRWAGMGGSWVERGAGKGAGCQGMNQSGGLLRGGSLRQHTKRKRREIQIRKPRRGEVMKGSWRAKLPDQEGKPAKKKKKNKKIGTRTKRLL